VSNNGRLFFDDTVTNIATQLLRLRRRKRRMAPNLRNVYCRIGMDMIWLKRYITVQFYRLFRVTPKTFEQLLEVILRKDTTLGLIKKKFRGGNNPMPPEKCLRYIGSQETLNSLADRFQLTDSTVTQIVNAFLYITVHLRNTYVI
jgi:hypothetical protein